MINWLHQRLHDPAAGWDPIPGDYAREYARGEWANVDAGLLDGLESEIGSLRGRSVLDLGGGPGQFSVAFARRGARVTWFDVSGNYESIAREHARDEGVEIDFVQGYLEQAVARAGGPFDLVFNRICWCYSRGDRGFARQVYDLVGPGGFGYIDSNTPEFEEIRGPDRIKYLLNGYLGIKVGHPHPPRGRIAGLLMRYPLRRIRIDYSSLYNDRILFQKA